MATGDGPPLSMRPFPVADKSPKSLADFIARVNALPGGFRSVTETSLEEELDARRDGTTTTTAAAAAGEEDAAQDDDVDMSDDANADDDEEDDDEDTAAKDPMTARMEVLRNIDIASNTAMLTLDSLSLLLSKHNPTQASLTLSQQLRELVGIGTMGADRLDDANTTPAKTRDCEAVAAGWTLMEISRTRDAAEDAAAFLGAEMAAEGRYWEGVMGVRQAGWSVCRVPGGSGDASTGLGVRFGFSEAAPEFQRNGLAPIRRGDDGVPWLDMGRLGGTPERLVVTYERGGKVVGRAASQELRDDDGRDDNGAGGDLQARVLGARNTIFAQELWHELTREARSLAAYDVHPDDEKRLVCAVDANTRIIVELLPASSSAAAAAAAQPQLDDHDDNLPENTTAEAISLALHILLTYAHRCNELLRIRPLPPHVPRTRGQHVHTLLRPVIARFLYARSARSATQLVGNLVQTLRRAGVTGSSFTLCTPQPTVADFAAAAAGPNQPSAAVSLVRHMLQPTDFALDVALLPGGDDDDGGDDVSFTVRGRTYLVPVTATYYHVLAPAGAAIHALCAPYPDGYPDLAALADYLCVVAARALAAHYLRRRRAATAGAGAAAGGSAAQEEEEDKDKGQTWVLGALGTRIRHARDHDRPQLEFVVERDAAAAAAEEEEGEDGGAAALRLTVSTDEQSWTWSASSSDNSAKETLEAVVDKVLQ
ncbi:RNA polymerase II mediator complex subunit [Beauveria asiatica]|uniref:Mediator of RNA polymerase II transcription subunit 17 n=1 Tax=Beauveria asiatica TaxID=1069075 RepID=A0AAW0S2B3_9HYPO